MPKVDINSDQWCDLVFENRNTEFGAFVLRKGSYKRHLKALIIATVVFLLAIAIPILVQKVADSLRKKTDETVRVMDYVAPDKTEKKEEIKPEIEQPKEVVRNTIQFVPPVITPDKDVAPDEEIKPTVEVIQDNKMIGTTTVTTGSDTEGAIPTTTTETQIAESPKEEAIIDVPQQQAQFPGGMSALYEFLGKQIQYPASAREAGIQGRVIVRFVVGRDGHISDVEIFKSLDPALDEEAVRVVRMMPPWSPGKQGDNAVKSRMILPVVFKIQ